MKNLWVLWSYLSHFIFLIISVWWNLGISPPPPPWTIWAPTVLQWMATFGFLLSNSLIWLWLCLPQFRHYRHLQNENPLSWCKAVICFTLLMIEIQWLQIMCCDRLLQPPLAISGHFHCYKAVKILFMATPCKSTPNCLKWTYLNILY